MFIILFAEDAPSSSTILAFPVQIVHSLPKDILSQVETKINDSRVKENLPNRLFKVVFSLGSLSNDTDQ